MNQSNDSGMTFWQHLNELRKCALRSVLAVAVGFSIAYYFRKEIFRLLRQPFDVAYENIYGHIPNLVNLNLLEAFMVYLKMSMLVGFFIASPVIFYQFWKFISPGLKYNEKKHVIPFVLLASLFFIGGALFGYYLVFPRGFEFFLSITKGENIEATIQMEEYYKLAAWMLMGFGVSFEGPLILLYLVYFRILTTAQLIKGWRAAVVAILVVSAVVTPTPDIGTMLMMALPLILMYALTIVFSIFVNRKKETVPVKID